MYRYYQRPVPATLEQVLAACPLHLRSINSKRSARRLILHYCDSSSLLSLRLVSRNIALWTSREEARYFNDIHVTLHLTEDSRITPASWEALERVGKLARRVIFTFVVKSGAKKIKFEKGPARLATLNPLPREVRFDTRGRPSIIQPLAPILGGVFRDFDVTDEEPDGLFKRVFDLTPNMQTLCIRDQVVWEDTRPEEMEEEWGRTLVDEALIYLRCQFEDSLLARAEELNRLEELNQYEQVAQIEERTRLRKQAILKKLTWLEEPLLDRLENQCQLNLVAQSEELARIKNEAQARNLVRLDELIRLEESVLAGREEIARFKEQARFPKLLEMQVGSPLALWHFRTFPGYGNGGDPLRGARLWGTIKTLKITFPAVIPGRSPGRKRIVKKGVYDFLAEFSQRIETLAIGFTKVQRRKSSRTSATIVNGDNPLVYDLDPEFGGGGETTFYPVLKKLGLKNMHLKWHGGLKEFFIERAPNCVDVVLVNCTFVSDNDCMGFYGLFELQNAQRLGNPGVPLVLTRKLRLPDARGFRIPQRPVRGIQF